MLVLPKLTHCRWLNDIHIIMTMNPPSSHLRSEFPVGRRCPLQEWRSWSSPVYQKPLFWRCPGCHTPVWSQRRTPWPYASQIHSPPGTKLCGRCPVRPDRKEGESSKTLYHVWQFNFQTWQYLDILPGSWQCWPLCRWGSWQRSCSREWWCTYAVALPSPAVFYRLPGKDKIIRTADSGYIVPLVCHTNPKPCQRGTVELPVSFSQDWLHFWNPASFPHNHIQDMVSPYTTANSLHSAAANQLATSTRGCSNCSTICSPGSTTVEQAPNCSLDNRNSIQLSQTENSSVQTVPCIIFHFNSFFELFLFMYFKSCIGIRPECWALFKPWTPTLFHSILLYLNSVFISFQRHNSF